VRKLKNKKFIIITAVVLVSITLVYSIIQTQVNSNSQNSKLSRIACMGDSLTEITGYPKDLQVLLGNGSVVGNFGVMGATINFGSVNPYIFNENFSEAVDFQPTTIVILLGTNDARADTIGLIENFTQDYSDIIREIQSLQNSSKARIFIAKPPPVLENSLNFSSTNLTEAVIPRIETVAQEFNLTVIDLYTPLLNHPEYYLGDGVHLNSEGAKVIANIIYEAIKNQ
jgi:lysophospholipase L1-like esterase